MKHRDIDYTEMRRLISAYGDAETVHDYETWLHVITHGEWEQGTGANQYWSAFGKLYRLCFRELPYKDAQMVADLYL